VSRPEDVWLPLVDEPIGAIVREVEEAHPDIAALVSSPRRVLAFRTFAYLRVGLLLGELLVEHDVTQPDEAWITALLAEPAHHDAVVAEVRKVAQELGSDPLYADEEPLGPGEDARARFRRFAEEQLGG
jgi:hypothetical protein